MRLAYDLKLRGHLHPIRLHVPTVDVSRRVSQYGGGMYQIVAKSEAEILEESKEKLFNSLKGLNFLRLVIDGQESFVGVYEVQSIGNFQLELDED